MPVYGATSTGFERKPFATILGDIQTRTRARLNAPTLSLDELDPFGAIVHTVSEELDQVWQLAEAAYYAFDALNAEDFLLFALGSLSGVEQLAPTTGLVLATVTLEAGKAFAPGELVASVSGEPENQWANRDAVESTTAGEYPCWFISVGTGSSYRAPAGSLTVIAQRKTGWIAITNAADAAPGEDLESADAFRVRRDGSVSRAGSASVSGIQADVEAVANVRQARVFENVLDVPFDGLDPHSVRVIVWDGVPSEANDAEVAQAIHDSKSAGISALGSLTGNAVDRNGDTVPVNFDRAGLIECYCAVTVVAPGGADVTSIRAAIQSAFPMRIGKGVLMLKANAAALSVEGVLDISSFALDTVYPPVNTSTNLTASNDEVLVLDSANIEVVIT